MGKNIFAIIAGLVVGSIGMLIVQSIGHYVYPIPEGIDPLDTEQLKVYIKSAPLGTFWFLLLSYAIGSLIGGVVCSLIHRVGRFRNGLIVGAIFMASGLVQLFTIPHPFWFSVLSELIYIPLSVMGVFLIKKGK